MEPLAHSHVRPSRRLAIKAYETVDAFDAVAWRPPSSRRYEAPANDLVDVPSFMDELKAMPAWVVPVTGAVIAAVMGMLLGGWLAV